jgi:hypothetical protein
MNDMFDLHQSELKAKCALNILPPSLNFKYSFPETYQKKSCQTHIFQLTLFSMQLYVCT